MYTYVCIFGSKLTIPLPLRVHDLWVLEVFLAGMAYCRVGYCAVILLQPSETVRGCLPFTQTTRMEIFGINTK